MFTVLLILLSLSLHLLVFFSLGFLTETLLKLKNPSFPRCLVLGYVVYFALFECLVLPMTFLKVRLSVFSIIWGILLCILVLLSVILPGKKRIRQFFRFSGQLSDRQLVWSILLALCIAFQVIAVVLYQDTSADGAYYVGTTATSVYTDTLGRYNPYTGAPLQVFPSRYIFSAYPMHNAFVSCILHIPAIIQSKTVMPALNVLAANSLYYLLGLRLFSNRKKQASLFVLFLFLLNLMTGTLYTPGTFLFTRSYEGKALLANFSAFFVLYCCLWLYQNKKTNLPWLLLFLGNICAITFSGTAIFLPILVCSAALPVLWHRRSRSQLYRLCLCLLPNIIYTLAYLAAEMNLLVLSAQ